jgi:O-glycosyl hydrolase
MLRRTTVDFARILREWDGFGVNYVQTCQTLDFRSKPQDYGGFDVLGVADRQRVIQMTFGDDGLRPGVVKMFLDPFHQDEPGDAYDWNESAIHPTAYDHERTTGSMRRFVRDGLQLTRERGDDLQVIVTLYGPPAWMTVQRNVRGRDLDPGRKAECAKYMASWVKSLRDVDGLPVHYVSLHNEGEDWMRWNPDGSNPGGGHDYNLYWPPEQVVDFLKLLTDVLRANGMADVTVTPGETSNWKRFVEWGYAQAIADDPEALAAMGLVTSHGFYAPGFHRWAGDYRSTGIDLLRAKRPDLHAWTTSTSWSKMDVSFLAELRDAMYVSKVNAIIPWACIQRPSLWRGGDPNPGTALYVSDNGELAVRDGYWWYRQVCRVGQPGTGVAQVVSNDPQIILMAFGDNGSGHGDAVVVLNTSDAAVDMELQLRGATVDAFDAWRTGGEERCAALGRFPLSDGKIAYQAPAQSATTFSGA